MSKKIKNPVAKFAHLGNNRASIFTDKKNDYSRKQKHKQNYGKDLDGPFPFSGVLKYEPLCISLLVGVIYWATGYQFIPADERVGIILLMIYWGMPCTYVGTLSSGMSFGLLKFRLVLFAFLPIVNFVITYRHLRDLLNNENSL